MEPQVAPLAAMFDLNTDLLLNCLDGLTDAEAQRRLEAGGNSVTFLASHLADSRHYLLSRLGRLATNPLARYLSDVRSIDEIRAWPSLSEIRQTWLPRTLLFRWMLLGPSMTSTRSARAGRRAPCSRRRAPTPKLC